MRGRPISCLLGIAAFAAVLTFESDPAIWPVSGLVSSAEARLGRPMTPVSAAGVARRTTRRVVRRTAVYVSTLPRGCGTVVVNGMSLYSCGGVYYQAHGNQYVVVEVR
ncbi:DUF6515 family protein [Stappia stellulata]|uniref:DUF6515 family protein n=1 Tax=Stappia stellulata TaxID=71235 RepID=UPI00056D4721|nr:DUF6515 family protein [Stappia stellulata]